VSATLRSERIALDPPLPAALRRDVEQGVYYCSDLIADARVDRAAGAWIELDLLGVSDAELSDLTRVVRDWVERTVASSLAYEDTIAREWGRPEAGFRATPEQVLASADLHSMGEGLVAYGPRLASVFGALRELWDRLAAEVGATPLVLPAVATLEHMQRCDFLRQFPQLLSFVTHFREDFGVIDRYAEACRRGDTESACAPPAQDMSSFRRMLRPAICYHVYPCFEGEQLAGDLRLVHAWGDCFRYESRNTTGLDRLFDFRMYEVVALGSADAVHRWRSGMMERVVERFEALGLPGRLKTSNDPFFVSGSVLKSTFQRAHDLKYELEVPFPNREGHLAVASFNEHQDFFASRFGITTRDGEVASSGCSAFGLDRILAALLVHHGTDVNAWPAPTRQTLGLNT